MCMTAVSYTHLDVYKRQGKESRFPHIPYVIFPGNVGEDATLREAVEILLGR